MLPETSTTSPPSVPNRFGVFWITERKDWKISREAIGRVAAQLGFCLFRGGLHQIVGRFITQCDERKFQDVLKDYIEKTENFEYDSICNAYEAFMQKSCKYTISRLPIISVDSFINDNATTCFKFFKDCYVKITAKKMNVFKYDQLPQNRYVLFSKVQQREYKFSAHGKYIDFLEKATLWEENSENIKSIIGYLSHEYKDETTGFIAVLTEQCPDPKDGGGSGKNLFCNLLSHTTTYTSKPGTQAKFDEKFFQSWNGERIFGISDVPKNFDFSFLKEPSTGSFIYKKLFKDEVEIPVSEGPKFVVQTNYSYEISDGGLKRRIKPIEFTDYFTKSGGVDVHYGCHFPKGWDENDWNNFDSVVLNCIQTWLRSSLKITTADLTETGWRKQFEHTHGFNLAVFIEERFEQWVMSVNVQAATVKDQIITFYNDNDIQQKYHYSTQTIASAIKEWSKHHGYDCKANVQVRFDLYNKKCYVFNKSTK